MNRFIEIVGKPVHIIWLKFCVVLLSILILSTKSMSSTNSQKPDYISSDIKKLDKADLKKALSEVNKKNKEIRESFRVDKDTLAFRTSS